MHTLAAEYVGDVIHSQARVDVVRPLRNKSHRKAADFSVMTNFSIISISCLAS